VALVAVAQQIKELVEAEAEAQFLLSLQGLSQSAALVGWLQTVE